MAASFLRKIILEEIQKVLTEQVGRKGWSKLDPEQQKYAISLVNKGVMDPDQAIAAASGYQYKGGKGEIYEPEAARMAYREKSGNIKTADVTNSREVAIKNLQRQLRKLGATQSFKGRTIPLKDDGVPGNFTIAAIVNSRIRELGGATEGLKNVESINKMTQDLSRLTPQQYAANTKITDQEFARGEQGINKDSVAPKNPLEGPGGKVEKPVQVQVGPTPEEIEQTKREAEEKREAERGVYPRVPGAPGSQQESLIRKEINKLLKQI